MRELPEGWVATPLKDLVQFVLGGDWGEDPETADKDMVRVRVIRGTEFRKWKAEKGRTAALRAISAASLAKRALRAGDIVVEVSGGGPTQPVGRVLMIDDGVIDSAHTPVICSNFARFARLRPEVDPRFVAGYLECAYLSGDFDDLQTQTTNLRNLNFPRFLHEVIVPMAPVSEQHRIADKLDEVLSRVSACRERLDKIPKLIARFRQAVLAAGCSGRLTADWRKSNPPDRSIAEALPRLHHRREGAAKTVAQRDRVREIYEEPESQDSDELPVDWQFVRLNKLCGAFDYGTSAKSSPSGRVPVLRMGNLQEGKLDWTDLVYTSDADEIEAYFLRPNTVLFNRTNSPELVGKTAIYRGERPAIFAGYLIRINPEPELDPEYLNLCLNAPEAKEFCRSIRTDGVSQSNINAQKLGTFEIPFCSIEEQREIVIRVNKLFALADRVQKRFEKARQEVDRLTQSVLARAFAGQLVPTEAELGGICSEQS